MNKRLMGYVMTAVVVLVVMFVVYRVTAVKDFIIGTQKVA